MAGILTLLAVQATIWVISYLLRPKPTAEIGRAQKIQIPRATEGAAMPLFWGRVRIESPLVLWSTKPVYSTQNSNLGWAAVTQLALGLGGHGDPGSKVALHRIWIDDKLLLNNHGEEPPSTDLVAVIFDDDFHGGAEFGGGVAGNIYFTPGTDTQETPDAIEFTWETGLVDGHQADDPRDLTLLPPYRGIAVLHLHDWYYGNRESPGEYQVEIQNGRPASPTGIHTLGFVNGKDENPVVALHDIVTNPWGRVDRVDPSRIDTTSWLAAGNTLAAEKHGFSLVVDQARDAADVVDEIIRQIDAVMYESATDGLIYLKLIRDDYTVGTLPEFDPSNVLELVQYSANAPETAYNEVRVTFTDRARDYKQGAAFAHNQAGVFAAGGRRTVTFDYPGITTKTIATRVASRELRVMSIPQVRVRLAVNRDGWELRPGDVIKWSWPDLGIVDMILRVMRHDIGELANGRVVLDCVEDKFAYDHTVFEEFPAETLPLLIPEPPSERHWEDAPRWFVIKGIESGQQTNSNVDVARGWYLAAPRGDTSSYAYDLSEDGSSFARDQQPHPFPSTATTKGTYLRTLDPYDTTTGLVIENVSHVTLLGNATFAEIQQDGKNLILVGPADRDIFAFGEIMAYESFTTLGVGQYRLNNVWRGLLDTAPVNHFEGERVYFLTEVTDLERASVRWLGQRGWKFGSTERARAVGGIGPIMATPSDEETEFVDSTTALYRTLAAYCPADITVAGSKAPAQLAEDGVAVTWRRRDRTSGIIVRGDAATETVESSVSYRITARKVRGYGAGTYHDVLTGLTGSATTTKANPARAGHGVLQVGVKAVRSVVGTGIGIGVPTFTQQPWQVPEIPITAPHWRNLLVNPAFADGITAWTVTAGALQTVTPGPGAAGSAADGTADPTSFEQVVDVTGWRPLRMAASLRWHDFGNGSFADTLQVNLDALDSADVQLATAQFGPSAVSTTLWTSRSLSIANLPTGTAKLRVRVTIDANAPSFDPAPRVTNFTLRLGQQTDQLLANADFEAALASWVTVAGTWETSNAGQIYTGAVYARPTAASTSPAELRQDVSVPAGFEYGTAVLVVARMSDTAGGSGDVILEALDAGSMVVATTSTGGESISPVDVWQRRALTLELPVTAVTLRVRLRVTDASPVDERFDDLGLRVHKHLDDEVNDVVEVDFSDPPPQYLPEDPSEWDLRFGTIPPPNYGYWSGASIQGVLGPEPDVAVDDDLAYDGAKLVGVVRPRGDDYDEVATPSLECRAGSAGFRVVDTEYAVFRETESFTAVVWVKFAEESLAAARGLCGRVGSIGWGLDVTAAGLARARLVGSISTASLTSAADVTDMGLHMVGMSWDATTDTLTLTVDGASTTVVNTTVGDIDGDTLDVFRIGKSAASDACPAAQFPRTWLWRGVALTGGQMESLFTHAQTPSGITLTRAGTVAACVVGSDSDGILVGRTSVPQFPYGRLASIWGAATQPNAANKAPSANPDNSTYWVNEGASIVPRAHVDPQGEKTAPDVIGSSSTSWNLQSIPLDATATVLVVWFARTESAPHSAILELTNSSDVVKGTHTYSVTQQWQMLVHTFSGWDGSTATAKLKFRPSNDGTDRQVMIAGLVFVHQQPWVPVLLPINESGGAANASSRTTRDAQLSAQLNREGEIVATVVGTQSTQAMTRTIAALVNTVNSNDKRDVWISSVDQVKFDHYDGAASATLATIATAPDWSVAQTVRARWCRAALLDVAAAFSRVVNGVNSAIGRVATWTPSAVPMEELHLGHDGGSDVLVGLVSSVTVTTREEILG